MTRNLAPYSIASMPLGKNVSKNISVKGKKKKQNEYYSPGLKQNEYYSPDLGNPLRTAKMADKAPKINLRKEYKD